MSAAPPLLCVFVGDGFTVLPRHLHLARQHYGEGEIVPLIAHEERSERSHRHYFAIIKDVWENLPEDRAVQFPTPEHLRAWALIKAGYCNSQDVVCATKAEALRWAPVMAAARPYSVVIPREGVVTIYTAKSQSHRAMPKGEFQKSKDAVLGILSELIAVEPAVLEQRAREVA